MAKLLTCPCGTPITGRDDEFVARVDAHLQAEHAGRTYPADMILAMASDIDDADVLD